MAAAVEKESRRVPEGFTSYRELYPATPAFALPELAPTERFATIWHALDEQSPTRSALLTQLEGALRGTTIVDHTQPVRGGSGFDSTRYRLATLLLFMDCLPADRSQRAL